MVVPTSLIWQVATLSPSKPVTALKRTLRCAAIFEKQGVPLEGFGRPGEMHLRATYESGVLFVLRFMVDTGVVRLDMRRRHGWW